MISRFPSRALALFATLIVMPPITSAAPSQSSKPPSVCTAADYRAFDFWVGDWDVFEFGNPTQRIAHTRVDSILNGCALHEDYRQQDGLHGESFSIYDGSRKVWHQSWVTNAGKLLVIEGKMVSGEMVLSGTDTTPDGIQETIRGTWKPVEGAVREIAVKSTDNGKTWTPWFDLMFRPTQSRIQSSNDGLTDEQLVAALDSEYQAAVKKNDAANMDRLLADDFILVTGSGKRFTKRDLVDEARSGRTLYTHQEDTERTVRLWGKTAVVTAKLWEQGTDAGKPFDYTVWFSDTYVRYSDGWRYVFGQSSLPLPLQK